MELGNADEQKSAKEGSFEAWARSNGNPMGGWYGLKKGLRFRVGAVQQPTHVLHIAEEKEWEARSDTYSPASFAEDGFIHCSTAAQLDRVANAL